MAATSLEERDSGKGSAKGYGKENQPNRHKGRIATLVDGIIEKAHPENGGEKPRKNSPPHVGRLAYNYLAHNHEVPSARCVAFSPVDARWRPGGRKERPPLAHQRTNAAPACPLPGPTPAREHVERRDSDVGRLPAACSLKRCFYVPRSTKAQAKK